jgi:ubiquinone/menaquinone biosynthesis C-methylase UbiE
MERIPEPELMDDTVQAQAYTDADFSASNQLFLDQFALRFPRHAPRHVIDLGCGPADIPIRFARRYPDCAVEAVDGSAAMLALAAQAVAGAGLTGRIRLRRSCLPDPTLGDATFDTIISNSLLHHLDDPQVLWQTIWQLAAPGAAVMVMDLFRHADAATAQRILDSYAVDAPEILRRDFRNSLYAAYTVDEVASQLDKAGLAGFQAATISDRHLLVWGTMER